MQRYLRIVALLAVVALVGGCSIAGTWETMKTEPTGMGHESPFDRVTFNDDGGYSATGTHGGEIVTNTGTYEWNGMKLVVNSSDGEERVYPGHYDAFKGQLVLHHGEGEEKVTAWMERVEEPGE